MNADVLPSAILPRSVSKIDIILHRNACRQNLEGLLGHPVCDKERRLLLDACSELQRLQQQKGPEIAVVSMKENGRFDADNIVENTISSSTASSPMNTWLQSNGLSVDKTKKILLLAGNVAHQADDKQDSDAQEETVSLVEAWKLAYEALARLLPDYRPELRKIYLETPNDLFPKKLKHPQPFTHDLGWKRLPFISMHFQETAADLLCVVHEFSHALQLVISQQSNSFYEYDMPPVARECCAFIGELALLEYLQAMAHPLFAPCLFQWARETRRYLGEDRQRLLQDLDGDSKSYHYRWNYPIARTLAWEIWKGKDAEQLRTLFSAGQSANADMLMGMTNEESGYAI